MKRIYNSTLLLVAFLAKHIRGSGQNKNFNGVLAIISDVRANSYPIPPALSPASSRLHRPDTYI